ncbi:MAG: TatD family hydrolase [Bacteroides sp.]|nr:TatD family hydrolase [Eubacterium sp.]MCM1417273.1 TatD family hydrolase [Roseburia sp.]MCM1461107.1 TatD family hydrolase [Bacteroides sp.]
MKVIDTHAHYDDEAFDADRFELLDELFREKVDRIVNVGCTLESSEAAIRLAERYGGMYAAVGIHPEETASLPDDYLDRLRTLCRRPKVVAVGEIGLDHHREEHDKELQRERFREQILLAREENLPIIVHSREATKETIELLAEYRPKGVVHCFSGSAETARELLDLGMMISFTGVLTFKNAKKAAEACKAIPLDRMMLETDSPYMSPVPYRGKRCHSGMIYEIAQRAAEIKGIATEELLRACNENAIRFFGLK